jgi:hypothetical protein
MKEELSGNSYSGGHGLHTIWNNERGEVGRLLGIWADLQKSRRGAEEEEQKDILDKLFDLDLKMLERIQCVEGFGERVIELITPIETRCYDCHASISIGEEQAEEMAEDFIKVKEENPLFKLSDIEFVCQACGDRHWADICTEMNAIVDRCKTLITKLS